MTRQSLGRGPRQGLMHVLDSRESHTEQDEDQQLGTEGCERISNRCQQRAGGLVLVERRRSIIAIKERLEIAHCAW